MQVIQGTFKLVYGGIEGYDLLFDSFAGFGTAEGRRSVPTLDAAIAVVEKVLGRQLTTGEKQTLAIGNGLVASVNSENYNTYF